MSGQGAGTGTRRFKKDPHLVVLTLPASPAAEGYRRIKMHLEQGTFEAPGPVQVTVITSPVPGEGKTTTATNLALAYAEDPAHRTLLVDADLRRPSVSRRVTPEPGLGLSEVLAGKATLDQAVVAMGDCSLWVLPSGSPRATPTELHQGEPLGELFTELRRRFERIVIDAPPTVAFTDAAFLAAHADGVLLVVRAGTTTMPMLRRARESLSGSNVLGVVLNEVRCTVVDRYYNRYDDYRPGRYAYAGRDGVSA